MYMTRWAVAALLLAAMAAEGFAEETKGTEKQDSGYRCEGKTTCKQMRSCEEARFYLTQCGVRRLDRDKDGVPCESLCKGGR